MLGQIYITDNLDVVYNSPLQTTRIISMDEDNIIDPNIALKGTCLLPPMEAKMAEIDGNEQQYNFIYDQYLRFGAPKVYISALLAAIYKGWNVMIFLPDIGEDYTCIKFVNFVYFIYGIHIGIIGARDPKDNSWYYDTKYLPIWLGMLYMSDVISPYEFLYQYPLEAPLNDDNIMGKLINDIKPYADNWYGQREYIIGFHKRIHGNPYLVNPIMSIR